MRQFIIAWSFSPKVQKGEIILNFNERKKPAPGAGFRRESIYSITSNLQFRSYIVQMDAESKLP